MTRRQFRVTPALALALALVVAPPGPAVAGETTRVYVTTDSSHLLVLTEAVTKLAVANPGIVDLHVISPTQVLLNGKAAGATAMTVFYPKRSEAFEIVVTPRPVIMPSAPLAAAEPHTVLVHRAGKVDNHQFVRNHDQSWLELSGISTASTPQSAAPLPKK
jgi:Flp pilus assembly secretin CpaC